MFAAGMMLGNRPVFSVSVSSSLAVPWILSVQAPQVFIGAPVLVRITVAAGIQLQSNSISDAAMILTGLPPGSEVELTNDGYLLGSGGVGGNGADFAGSFAANAGGPGGPALTGPGTGRLLRLVNGSGRIWGGGGGGGGGGYNLAYIGSPVFAYGLQDGGSGGGGGAGSGVAGNGYGSAGASSAGTAGASGAGGSSGTTTQGSAGRGGAGGAYGAAGSAGANGINYGGGPTDGTTASLGAAGGAAGNAIELNGGSIIYTSTGDIRGSVT